MKKPDQKWKDAFLESLQGPVLRGDYRTALKLAKSGMKLYPDEFLCRYQYAKLLGDFADELPPAQRKKLKCESIDILRPLLRRLRGVSVGARFGTCLNFYYQSEDFFGMYAFSQRFKKFDSQKGLYGQGLAAGLIAFQNYEKKKSARAKTWAQKSVKAWAKYHLAKDSYYFAHYSVAKSYALAGENQKAMKHLNRAAKLAKRPISDWEFADILQILKS
jgi:hypothetical protein